MHSAVCIWLLSPVLNLVVVAVLCDRLLWGWALCLNHNKEDYYKNVLLAVNSIGYVREMKKSFAKILLFNFTRNHLWNRNKRIFGWWKVSKLLQNFLDRGYTWNRKKINLRRTLWLASCNNFVSWMSSNKFDFTKNVLQELQNFFSG